VIICFRCSARTKALLDNILEAEQYEDYSEVIASAVENLAILQEDLSDGAQTVIIQADGQAPVAAESPLRGSSSYERSGGAHRNEETLTEEPTGFSSIAGNSIEVPDLFWLKNEIAPSVPVMHQRSDVWAKGQDVPLERWIFGQYNKLLPAKASCRALANLSYWDKGGVPLQEAAERISMDAVMLGQVLARRDKASGATRGDALTTAFPSADENAEKSRLRYANQFVATVNKQGQVSGLLIDLKLINYKEGKQHRLFLTEAGKHFAFLSNPVLDDAEQDNTWKFRPDERSFLLEHISTSVPVEDFAYRSILDAVNDGANTPKKIDRALHKYISPEKEETLTESFLASQRSGAISRMEDLGLVVRIREGVRVTYSITEAGNRYMRS
jgi:hypothetical protein